MDKKSDVQIVDVSEPERESDEFKDGVCKKKTKLQQISVKIY